MEKIHTINVNGEDYKVAEENTINKYYTNGTSTGSNIGDIIYGKAIKPTSQIGSKYFFSNGISLHPRAFNINLTDGSHTYDLVTNSSNRGILIIDMSQSSNYEGYSNIEFYKLGSCYRGYNGSLTYNSSYKCLIEIIATPTLENTSWFKCLPIPENANTISPYLKILNGRMTCIKTIKDDRILKYLGSTKDRLFGDKLYQLYPFMGGSIKYIDLEKYLLLKHPKVKQRKGLLWYLKNNPTSYDGLTLWRKRGLSGKSLYNSYKSYTKWGNYSNKLKITLIHKNVISYIGVYLRKRWVKCYYKIGLDIK